MSRALGRRREKREGRWQRAGLGLQVVLRDPEDVEAELVGRHDKLERVGVGHARMALGAYVGKKSKPETRHLRQYAAFEESAARCPSSSSA
jgi:hypothetical protein